MIRSLALLSAVCGAVGLVASPADAGSGLEDFVHLEVLDGGQTRSGTHRAALRVVLADGWKTYWRAPGDSGIPPQFDWIGSSNIAQVSITWPTPEVFDQDGIRTIGYKHQMVLPLEIRAVEPGQPIRLKGEIEFGLCEDICVPAVLSFDLPLDAGAPRSPAIAAALAERPFSADEAGVRAATCRIIPSATGLKVEAMLTMPSAGGAEVAVIEPGDPQVWASQAITRRQGEVLRVVSEVSHVSGSGFDLDPGRIRITVLGQNHAVDILGCSPSGGG